MSLTRIAFEGTYRSGISTEVYQFTITVDQSDNLSVRDIQSPNGLIMDSMTGLPQSVIDDINTAIGQVENLLSVTSAINGTLTFTAETEKSVSFTTPMSSTDYRVHLDPSEFVPVRVINRLTTGFTVQVGTTFTGTIGYDVLV